MRKKSVLYIVFTALFVLYLFSNKFVYSVVGYLRDKPYSVPTYTQGKKYKYAIVLGGFGSMNHKTGEIKFGEGKYIKYRLLRALELWDEGVVEKILITGDATSCLNPDGSSDKGLFLKYMYFLGYPKEIFEFEQCATTTYENALLTCDMLKEKHVKGEDCILITSSYHMMRGLACFRKQGYDMPYCCAAYRTRINCDWKAFLPTTDVYRNWKLTFHEWGGMICYWWNGYV